VCIYAVVILSVCTDVYRTKVIVLNFFHFVLDNEDFNLILYRTIFKTYLK
jgi:hypothetical protein